MSESIQLKYLSDIRNAQWCFRDGGRVKRNGTYKGVDYYPKYFYDARINMPVSIANMPLQWIHFRMISPRTRTHPDKIGMIQISYKFVNFQSNTVFTNWCNEYLINDWLEQCITSGLSHISSSSVEIPIHRRVIQKLNEQQKEEGYNGDGSEEYDWQDRYEDEEYENMYNYKDYSWNDMIDDAFEGDESNYWNID